MTALQTINNQTFPVDLFRDQCVVIASHQSDPMSVKKQFSKLNRILKTMPLLKIDPVVELKKTRNKRGLV